MPQTLEEKRVAALAWLGTRWIFHPQSTYKPTWRAFK
jgi:hypothetical protein